MDLLEQDFALFNDFKTIRILRHNYYVMAIFNHSFEYVIQNVNSLWLLPRFLSCFTESLRKMALESEFWNLRKLLWYLMESFIVTQTGTKERKSERVMHYTLYSWLAPFSSLPTRLSFTQRPYRPGSEPGNTAVKKFDGNNFNSPNITVQTSANRSICQNMTRNLTN